MAKRLTEKKEEILNGFMGKTMKVSKIFCTKLTVIRNLKEVQEKKYKKKYSANKTEKKLTDSAEEVD